MDIGGLDRSAVVSSGRIPMGRWGNIPGGETFIAPIEGTANGSICLNGAFRGHVLAPAEALVLEFVDGRLDACVGPPEVTREFEALFKTAMDEGDPNWRMLAELGIGANDGVRELKGVSLFDEKCLGTLHIALGDNTTFGGKSEASVHEDLVIVEPTLLIDEKPILNQGLYVLRPGDWQDRLEDLPGADVDIPAEASVWRGVVEARPRDGHLVVEKGIADGRLNSYVLGDERATVVLARIYARIPVGTDIRYGDLLTQVLAGWPEGSPEQVARGLAILQKHRVAVVRKSNGGRR